MRAIGARGSPRLYLAAFVGAGIVALLPLSANPYQLTVAVNLCITLILTLSLNFVVGNSGQFHLSHVGILRHRRLRRRRYSPSNSSFAVAVPRSARFSPLRCLPR